MSYNLNSLKGGYIADWALGLRDWGFGFWGLNSLKEVVSGLGEYYRGYYQEFRP